MKKAKYKEGDMVTHRTGKRKMIVIDAPQENFETLYDCRWETKDDFGFGSFKEYELRKLKIKKTK